MSHLAWVELKRDRTHFILSCTCFNLNLLFSSFCQEVLKSWSDNHTLKCTAPPKNINVRHCIFFPSRHLAKQSVVVVQPLSCVQLFVTPWTAAPQASLSITISWSLLKLMSVESVMPSNHVILCHSLLFLPSIFPSISVFSNESALHIKWPKYWNFSFRISPSSEHSGPRLISFRIDWFDLLAVQGILGHLLQHHSSKVYN